MNDIREINRHIKENLDEETIKLMIEKADSNNDGRKQVDIQRYVRWVQETSQKIPKRQADKAIISSRQLHKIDNEVTDGIAKQTISITSVRWPWKWLNWCRRVKNHIDHMTFSSIVMRWPSGLYWIESQ